MANGQQTLFTYQHSDSDTTHAELEEFFSYVEIPGVVGEGRESWERGWHAICDQGSSYRVGVYLHLTECCRLA